MIVPAARLLLWFAVVAIPAALLGAVDAGLLPVALALMAVLLGVALLDAVLGFGRLDGLAVELPVVTRFTEKREGRLEVRLRNPRQRVGVARLAFVLPATIEALPADLRVTLPAGSEWSRLTWPCRPGERGCFRVTEARLEVRSPLGFWDVRTRLAVQGELRVYPNLAGERRNLAALFLNRSGLGAHAQRQVGQGRDFEKLREYVPGDSFDEVHWKATAKRGRPITKIFQLERTQEVYVVIDTSRLSGRKVRQADARPRQSASGFPGKSGPAQLAEETAPVSTLERFITAALVFGLAAEKQGDHFGLVTFSDRVDRFLRARNGRTHYHACRDALFALAPRAVSPDFDELATFLRLRLRRRALLIVLTALDDPVVAEAFVRDIELVRRQHLVLVNMLKPDGADPLFAGPELDTVDALYDRLGGHLRWSRLRELEAVLRRRGVRFSLLSSERLGVELVNQYLSVKQRQAL